jgi:hypothetical protein
VGLGDFVGVRRSHDPEGLARKLGDEIDADTFTPLGAKLKFERRNMAKGSVRLNIESRVMKDSLI